MVAAIWVAVISASATIGAAIVAAWQTRDVHRAKELADANAADLERKRFAMDYYERMTLSAVTEATRCQEQLALVRRELEAIYRDKPELEEVYREYQHRDGR